MSSTRCSDSPPGYHGRYLRVDLDEPVGTYEPLPTHVLRRFLGGSGLGTWLLLQSGGAEVDPLAGESPIVFALSSLVGSPLTTSAKFAVVAKSPLTDRINDSLVSSGFALAAKKCGFDALLIRGRAERPSILIIDDGQFHLEPAGGLWGATCDVAERELRARFGTSFQAAVIGPAGENLVRYATVSHAGRHAGRGGHGAVLGSKNIKAILVRGTQRCRWAKPEELATEAKTLSAKSLGPATAKYRELGTAANLLAFNRLHTLPTHNFQSGSFPLAADLSPEKLAATRGKTRASCAACTIGCEHIYEVRSGPGEDAASTRVEYENLFALGSLCGVGDADAVLAASRRCDQLGIDTISTGATIAFAMECVARGILKAEWLTFGSSEALLRALDMIARREALGDALADGSRLLARQLGAEAMRIAPHVKGLELPGYEPRTMQTLALGMAVNARGADHNRSGAAEIDLSSRGDRRHLTAEAATLAVETEDKAALLDSLILCKFLRQALEDYHEDTARMLRQITGWDVSADEMRTTARRIVSAKKLFNIRAGWTPEEDRLPDRFLDDTLSDEPNARLSRTRLQDAIRAYNQVRGWSAEGWIGEGVLRELGLMDC